jgi:sec-independent protein translocase protein TatA
MAIPLGAFNLGPPEILFILVFGVLLFGKRLTEIGRYLGRGIVDFKKGMKRLDDEMHRRHGRPGE